MSIDVKYSDKELELAKYLKFQKTFYINSNKESEFILLHCIICNSHFSSTQQHICLGVKGFSKEVFIKIKSE